MKLSINTCHRLHVFLDSKESANVWLNIMPGTVDTLPADIRHYNSLESFPVILYPMKNRDGKHTKAPLFPPADPGRKYGLHSLGLINTLSMRVPTDGPEIAVDPGQLVRCTRYDCRNYRVSLELARKH